MQRFEFICPKCGKRIIIETDSKTQLSESQMKKLHKCEVMK